MAFLSGPQYQALIWIHIMTRPSLSQVTTTAGSIRDVYRVSVGIRTIRVEGTKFLINSVPFYFKGFGKHEDSDVSANFSLILFRASGRSGRSFTARDSWIKEMNCVKRQTDRQTDRQTNGQTVRKWTTLYPICLLIGWKVLPLCFHTLRPGIIEIESNNKTTTDQSLQPLSLDDQSPHNQNWPIETTTRGILNTI